jgi:antitoxin ParD1/3/4
MSSSLNVSLTDELRRFVDARASDQDVYSTPSEYIRDLIRRDMREHGVVSGIVEGIRQAARGELVEADLVRRFKDRHPK